MRVPSLFFLSAFSDASSLFVFFFLLRNGRICVHTSHTLSSLSPFLSLFFDGIAADGY